MVNRDVAAEKLAQLALRLNRVRTHAKGSAAELAADADATDLVSFNLMVAIQNCLDLASHIISDAQWPPVRTLGEAFVRLCEHGVISSDAASSMQRAAGFRKVIAHGYANVDVAIVHRAATTGVEDVQRFAHEVALWLERRGA
ncbi:MAG TPA: DUF86 domain-containing protein [Polyangiales bacterium]